MGLCHEKGSVTILTDRSVGTENGASAQNRARANWKRAYRVAIKQVGQVHWS